MQTRVKICGLTRAQDIEVALAAGVDFIGFIVEATSPRRLSALQAARLAAPIKGLAARVAVTVNPDDELLGTVMREMAPDYIQCHGDETPERVAEITRLFSVKTIKAVQIASASDMKTAQEYSGVCEFILYDAKPPSLPHGLSGKPNPVPNPVRGGHGIAIDWDIIARAPLPKIFALAGGLSPDTVARAITRTGAPIVDVSSGVETAPGIKCPRKIQAFMEAVKNG